jgi:hypothetical protein
MRKSKSKKMIMGPKEWLRDMRENFHRYFPGPLVGIPKYGLGATQVYPLGQNLYPALEQATKILFSDLDITNETPVASIGTCFAEEFSGFMKNSGGHYLQMEANVFNASAKWGRVYTIPNLKQIVTYSLSQFPADLEMDDGKYLDPLREKSIGYFPSAKVGHEEIAIHRANSRKVFETAEVLVMTLGQNEAWSDSKLNIVWGSIPPTRLREQNPDRFKPVIFDYKTCVEQLKDTISLLRSKNPSLKIILTVSPVAAYATFSSTDVITQSMEGKSILRSVVGEVGRELENVYYFPSYEMVMCNNPHTFNADNRHVKRGTVAHIFSLLSNVI